MNDTAPQTALALPGAAANSDSGARQRLDALAHTVALAGLVCAALLTGHDDRWDFEMLAIITTFTAVSEFTTVAMPSGSLHISGSLLGITVAAVLLGGAPAAIVATVIVAIGWLRTREDLNKLRHNTVNFTWFAFLSGLIFRSLPGSAHPSQPSYYLLVFAVFLIALVVNFTLATGYVSFLTRTSFWHKLPQLKPIVVAEVSSGVLTLVAVYLANKLHTAGLVLFALVLVIFQYLVGELLTSEKRGRELQTLASTDELTGLANRKRFADALDEEIARAREGGGSFGVLLLDLDRFKDVNDTLGHEYGDELLAELGPRLAQRFGESAVVARFGGDEFAILPEQRTGDVNQLGRIADEVLVVVQEPITLGDVTLEVDASVGVVRFPADGSDAQTLLRRADIAMYSAKEHRDGFRMYNPDREQTTTAQLSLLADFRRALENDELILYYHPIIDLREQRVSGAEALVRWLHPERGLLQPAVFIELVEQTGMIGKMTEIVLDKAMAECARWRGAGQELSVGVNLSVRNLLDPGLPNLVKNRLLHHGLPPEALKLEITESMIMSDPDRAIRTVRALGVLGVKLAVDDFGTGYSSLANLRRLPIDELKIDRSFVTPMLTDESDMVIVRSTIELGHALGLQVIAEGVETADTLRCLERLGCDRAQGHFMSTPMPAMKFPDWSRAFEDGYRSAA